MGTVAILALAQRRPTAAGGQSESVRIERALRDYLGDLLLSLPLVLVLMTAWSPSATG